MKLQIKHLNLIKAIATEGTLTRAARQLQLSQPALSQQLKAIESKLNAQFFDRSKKKWGLTTAGKELLACADSVLPAIQKTEEKIEKHFFGVESVIRITTECYTCYHWLPKILKNYNDAFPDVELRIVPEATPRPLATLVNKEIDLAIISGTPILPRAISHQHLFEDEVFLVTSQNHNLAKRNYVKAIDFLEEPFVMYTEAFEQNYFAQSCLIPAGIQPQKLIKLQLTEAIIEIVRAGMGITVMPEWLASRYIEEGDLKLVRITRNGMFRKWGVAYQKQKRVPDYLVNFINQMSKAVTAGVPSNQGP